MMVRSAATPRVSNHEAVGVRLRIDPTGKGSRLSDRQLFLLQQLAVLLDVARHQLLENFGRVLVGIRSNS